MNFSQPEVIIAAAAASTTTATTVIAFGAPWEAVVVGLLSAILVSFWLDKIDSPPKAAAAMLFAGLLAGVLAPLSVEYLIDKQYIRTLEPQRWVWLMAVLIGAAAPKVIPPALKVLVKKTEDAA